MSQLGYVGMEREMRLALAAGKDSKDGNDKGKRKDEGLGADKSEEPEHNLEPVNDDSKFYSGICVTNTPKKMTDAELNSIFARAGPILESTRTVSVDKHRVARSQLIIRYNSSKTAKTAVEMFEGVELNGSTGFVPTIQQFLQPVATSDLDREFLRTFGLFVWMPHSSPADMLAIADRSIIVRDVPAGAPPNAWIFSAYQPVKSVLKLSLADLTKNVLIERYATTEEAELAVKHLRGKQFYGTTLRPGLVTDSVLSVRLSGT